MNRVVTVIATSLVYLTGCTVIHPGLLDESDDDGATENDAGSMSDSGPSGDAGDVPAIDLAVHYEFEGTGVVVSDSSGRGFDASLTDLSMRTSEGRTVGGIAMSGALPPTQFVELPSGFLDGVDDFTIAVWVKFNTIRAWARIYDIGNGLGDPAARFMYLTPSGASGVHAASYGGSPQNESTLTTGTELPAGVWKHLALTGHGGDRILYIDGFPVKTLEDGPDVPPLEMEPVSPNSWLGKSRFVADPGLDGTLDDFRVYGRVLSASEIADLAWPQRDYSHWRFDGAATDSSDNGVGTALVDGATFTTAGRLGSAVDLAGGIAGPFGPHVVFSSNPLANCNEELTIAVWVKLREHDAQARVFDFGTEDDQSYLYLAPSDGTGLHLGMKSPAGTVDVVTSSLLVPADDTWHHLAATINASNLVVLYVDGIIAITRMSSPVGASAFSALDENLLGKSRFATDPYLNGSLDELRIACRAFTADEIRNLSRP